MFSFSHLLLSFQRENILRHNLRKNGREVNIIPLLGSVDSQKDQFSPALLQEIEPGVNAGVQGDSLLNLCR